MSFQAILWSIVALAFLVVAPIALIGCMVGYFRGRGSERHGSGGFSAGVGAALQELDRLTARPSFEHQVESERHVTKRDAETGGE